MNLLIAALQRAALERATFPDKAARGDRDRQAAAKAPWVIALTIVFCSLSGFAGVPPNTPALAFSPVPPAAAAPPAHSAPPERTNAGRLAPPSRSPQRSRTEPHRQFQLHNSAVQNDAQIQRAHEFLQRSELREARTAFEKVLYSEPENIDALLALATLAQHEQRIASAEQLRRRALVASPVDPAVQAAWLNGEVAESEPQVVENRLKSLLAAQPESAPLNFSLGNLYARQLRWPEAQQAYFNAVAADGDNPDYLFNLAVALDRMHQPHLAASHYRLAREAARQRPAAFDGDAVHRRLAELTPPP